MKEVNSVDMSIHYLQEGRYDVLAKAVDILFQGLSLEDKSKLKIQAYRQNCRLVFKAYEEDE